MSDKEIAETIHKLLTLLLDKKNEGNLGNILEEINKIITKHSDTSAIQEEEIIKNNPNSEQNAAQNTTSNAELDATTTPEQYAAPNTGPNAIVGGKKALTKYNIFMRSELERLKQKKPKADHKTRFKEAVNNWKKSNKQ